MLIQTTAVEQVYAPSTDRDGPKTPFVSPIGQKPRRS
jgi:hypothetical protein